MIAAALLAGIFREVFAKSTVASIQSKAPAGTLAWFSLPAENALSAGRVGSIIFLALALIGWRTAALGGLLAVLTGWGLKYLLIARRLPARAHPPAYAGAGARTKPRHRAVLSWDCTMAGAALAYGQECGAMAPASILDEEGHSLSSAPARFRLRLAALLASHSAATARSAASATSPRRRRSRSLTTVPPMP